MAQDESSKPSFSGGRRWLGALNTIVAAAAALAVVIMLNYLSAGHFRRFQLSRDASFKLSPPTKAVLESLTNDVYVTMFFQPDGDNQEIYGLTSSLLAEYQNANPKHVHVTLLDYSRFAGAAKELLSRSNLTGSKEKDFVLIECGTHRKTVDAHQMADYDFSDLMAGRSKFVRRNAFRGEMLFTSDIYSVSHPQALKTYFLRGHGENDPGDPAAHSGDLGQTGYSKLASLLKEECDSDWDRLLLFGTNEIPHDCQLLVIAGPKDDLAKNEVDKISAYLKSGGRLLVLLTKVCSLDAILAKQWGVRLGTEHVVDKDPRFNDGPYSFRCHFNPHHIVDPLIKDETPLEMFYPRPLYLVEDRNKVPGGPEVSILATTGDKGTDENNHTAVYYLLAAVEQGVIKDLDAPHGGGTKIIVGGDAEFLNDTLIETTGNHVFAKLALSWLLQRPAIMVEGIGPQPIKEYIVRLTTAQSLAVHWLFLAGMPAVVLALGGLVWLRRRR